VKLLTHLAAFALGGAAFLAGSYLWLDKRFDLL
jgi:hypothetical protein